MADNDAPEFTVEFEETGEQWTNVTEYSIASSFITPTDAWSFTVYDDDPIKLRRLFYPLRPVKLYIGDRLQVVGRIDRTIGSGGGSSALRVFGRDYLANIVMGGVDPRVRVTTGMTLADAILAALKVFGITEIETNVDEVRSKAMGTKRYESKFVPSGLALFKDSLNPDTRAMAELLPQREIKVAVNEPIGDAKPSEGQGAFDWCDRLAARQGLTVQPGSKRTSIAVVRPDFSRSPAYVLKRPGNIEDATASRDYGELPTTTNISSRVTKKKGATAPTGFRSYPASGPNSPASLWLVDEGQRIFGGSAIIEETPPEGSSIGPPAHYQPLFQVDNESKDEKQLDNGARRILADRMRRTLEYQCTVTGHADPVSSATYTVDNMALVEDGVEDVNETLWLIERELGYQKGAGKQANLTLVRPASYVL